jgi:hypothetical protein
MAAAFGSYDPNGSTPAWADIATLTASVALGIPSDSPTSASVSGEARTGGMRQTFATGKEWYDYFADRYGAQNVDWVSGSGRTVSWPSELPRPGTSEMIRVPPANRSGAFVSQLQSVAGPRPSGAIAHHTQPLGLNGIDNGLINGSWIQDTAHLTGHGSLNTIVNSVPYGTWVIIK